LKVKVPGGPQPSGVETPPRLHRWMSERVMKILEAIPYDGWVSAAEIAAETGISERRVSALIVSDLLGAYVERKPIRLDKRERYLYRRLHRVDASRRIPDP
jgi:DNA-binding MarR family transcriptional regulator